MSQQGRLSNGAVTSIETLTGNTGGPIGPDGDGNINVIGDNGIIVSGNPGTSTLTIENDVDGFPITPFVVGPVGQAGYQTIQDGLDAANAAGGGAVYVQVGTYTEDLNLYANVDLWGVVGIADTGTCKIIGQHTPPSSGSFTIRNIFLESATNIFNSAAAGTGSIILIDCAIDVTNGYTFNCPNWTGGFACFDIGEIGSTDDGWVNNTGGATVFMTNITMGAGTSNTMIASGFVEIYNCAVQCPVDFQTGANGIIAGGSYIQANMTFSNNSTFEISNCLFSTGSSQAITYDSSDNSSLSSSSVNSTNSPAIGGTGVGTLTLTNISFPNNSAIAGTFTTAFGVTQSGNAYLENISFDEGSNLLDADGEIWIGSGAGNPAPGLITSTGSSITVSVGANTINLETAGSVAASFPTDSGTAIPAANALTVAGGTLLGTAGVGSTVTVNVDDTVVGGVATDSGAVTPSSNNFTITGGTGCSTSGATDTVTINVDDSIPASFPTDSGTAIPAANALTVAGGTLLGTAGVGSTVTVNVDDTVVGGVATDSGAVTPSLNNFTITGGTGCSTSGATDTVTINVDDSIPASFPTDSGTATPAANALTVAGGTLLGTAGVGSTVTVNVDDTVVGGVATDSGAVTPSLNNFTITGGTGCSTSGATDTVTINVDDSIPSAFVTDSGTATPSGNSIDILGGTNINTAGLADAVTVNLDTNINVGTIDCTQVTVDPGASGDSFVQFDINVTGEFRVGVDDDDDDAFKISQGSALGTNDTQVITADGEVTFPLTPAFLAYLASDDTNVTGAGTNYTVGTNVAFTEVFDQNSDFNTNGTFTAPITGRYELSQMVSFDQITSLMTFTQLSTTTSNRNFVSGICNPAAMRTVALSADRWAMPLTVIADMDAGDTATVIVAIAGGAGDTADLSGGANPTCSFAGKLLC